MVRDNVLCHVKPEARHLREHGAFSGDSVVQDNVKAADAVGRDHDQAFAVIVDLPYLTFPDRFHSFIPFCLAGVFCFLIL